MTAVLDRRPDTAAPVIRHRRRRVVATSRVAGPVGTAVTAVLVAVGAFVLRQVHIASAYDLFIDEITYRQIADNVARGDGLTLYGAPFTLHPPTVFLLLGAVARAGGMSADTAIDEIMALRTVGAVAGSLVVALVFVLLRRLGCRWIVAATAAVLLAVDPFQISFDSRVLLEPYAQVFALATVLAVTGLRTVTRPWPQALLVTAAGLLGALTLTSKETFGLVLGLTLFLAFCLGLLPRRPLACVMGVAVGGYLASAAVVSSVYGWGTWWGTRLDGAARLVGTEQTTGFNAPTTQVTLVSRLVNDLSELLVTYGVLVLGGIGALLLIKRSLWRPTRPWRSTPLADRPLELLVPIWALSACAYLAYATLAGSIEEQMYYIPLTPCLLTLVLWARGWAAWVGPSGRTAATWVTAALVLAPVAFNLVVWQQVHSVDRDSYRQLMAWEPDAIADGSRIAVTEDSAQFLITDATLGQWGTEQELQEADADYVIVQTKLVREGYGIARPELLALLVDEGREVFRAPSGDPGDDSDLVVYDVRAITGGS